MTDIPKPIKHIQKPVQVNQSPSTPQVTPGGFELSIKVEELRQAKIFVATPMYGGQCHGLYMKSSLDLQMACAKYGIDCRFSFIFNESLITRARNYLVDEFLRSGMTHLLFIDSDIHYEPNDVLALVALSMKNPNVDIIGGPYPKKSINWSNVALAARNHPNVDPKELESLVGDYVFNPVKGGPQQFNVQQPLEVMEIGTGFMLVKREVFDDFAKAYPQKSYKPDHRGTQHFDGSREIHAYFDCVIDPETKRYLSEDYMFCLPASSKVETEDGLMSIKKIVDSEYSGKVKSINQESGKVSWNRVVGHSVRKNDGKVWVKVNTDSDNNKRSKLHCTSDHRIAVVFDVLDPKIEYISALEAAGKFLVKPVGTQVNALYSKDQLSFLVGTLLGDATISKAGQLSITHSDSQVDYLQLKSDLFGGKINVHLNSGFGEGKLVHVMHAPINAQTKELRRLLYVNGTKTVKNILSLIDEKSLAFWYMDDGSTTKQGDFRLSTYGFSDEDHELLVDFFSEKWGVKAIVSKTSVEYKGEKREYSYLRFNMDDSKVLFNQIAPYIHENLLYKLPEEFRIIQEFDFLSISSLEYAASRILEIEDVKKSSKLYDIEVENDHSFVANGAFVHNCQWARAIGKHVWLCPWMRTQHIGSYHFTGDMRKIAQYTGQLFP